MGHPAVEQMDRPHAGAEAVEGRLDLGDRADAAEIDRWVTGKREPLAEEDLPLRVGGDATAAEIGDPADQIGIDLVTEDSDNHGESGFVRYPAALDLDRCQSGRGHRPV